MQYSSVSRCQEKHNQFHTFLYVYLSLVIASKSLAIATQPSVIRVYSPTLLAIFVTFANELYCR